MPSYTVSTTAGTLAPGAKRRLAAAITRIHAEVTGADGLFARVAIQVAGNDDCFLGGAPLAAPHCFIDARIRAGRTAEVRDLLVSRIVDSAAEILEVPRAAVWLYLTELAPAAMIEYGRALPEPGGEADWLAALPDEDRALLPRVG